MNDLADAAPIFDSIKLRATNEVQGIEWPELTALVSEGIRWPSNDVGQYVALLPWLVADAIDAQASSSRAIDANAAWQLMLIACKGIDDLVDGDIQRSQYLWSSWPMPHTLQAAIALWTSALRISAETSLDSATFRDMNFALHGQTIHSGVDLETYLEHVVRKSGQVFRAFSRLGAIAADGDQNVVSAFANYGLALGTLHQLVNDWSDFSKPYELTDFYKGHFTLPVVIALDQKDGPARRELSELVKRHNALEPQEWRALPGVFRALNTDRQCLTIIRAYQKRCLDTIKKLPATQRLQAFVELYGSLELPAAT